MAIPLVTRLLVMVLFREGLGHLSKGREREMMLRCAQHRANELGRPLILIESHDPREGRAIVSGCCPSSQGAVTSLLTQEGDVPVASDSAVVLCCYCLESVRDIHGAWREIMRVAGSPSNVFVAHGTKSIFKSIFSPGRRWIIESAPPVSPDLMFEPVSRPYPPTEE